MSGFFDDASWVLIPEGIKEDVVYAQKPTNGLGDLTFTRASDATRTNSAGVIERTPWNLFTQSVWTGGGLNVAPTGWTSNLTTADFAPSTTTNGDVSYRFYGTAGRRFLSQGVSVIAGQQYRLSVYVNSVTTAVQISSMIAQIGVSTTNTKYYIDNVEVSIGTIVNTACRIAISFDVTTTGTAGFRIGGGVSANSTHDFVLSQPQVVEGLTMKPYFATTNRQDVPRLDYRNADGTLSTCPRLLLEPQRTNLVTFSEDFSNAAWSKTITGTGIEASVVANAGISPSGSADADLITLNSGSGTTSSDRAGILRNITGLTTGLSYTETIWLKGVSGGEQLLIGVSNIGTLKVTLTTEWQRFVLSGASGGTFNSVGVQIRRAIQEPLNSYAQFYAWGSQLEAGAYPTTYIPTTTAAVTRTADAIVKTGISSLIGQTEGTLFVDFVFQDNDTSVAGIFSLSDGTTSNRIYIGRLTNRVLKTVVATGGTTVAEINSTDMVVGQRYKAAVAYKLNDFAFYVNGSLIGTDKSGAVPATSQIQNNSGSGASPMYNLINQAALFPERLTDAQLAELTTI